MPSRSIWQKRVIGALALLLALLAMARVASFWACDPMLAYANSFDQIRSLSALGLAPEGLADRFQATPTAPYRWFQIVGGRHYHYPSSDILLSELYYDVSKLFSHDRRVDIKNKALFLLLLWLAGLTGCFVALLKVSPWWALAFSAWVYSIADPINLLFLNTLYAEFSACVALTVLLGIACVGLAKQRLGSKTIWGSLALLLFLATNRQQYMLLPLVVIPIGWISFRALRRPSLIGASLLVMALPPTLYSMQVTFDHLGPNGRANRMDTVMGALLPAATSSAEMLEALGLPQRCAPLIGKDWYGVPLDIIQSACPEVLQLPLSRYLGAVAHDPLALWRMSAQGIRYLQGLVAVGLGHVEGNRARLFVDLPEPKPWTVDITLRKLDGSMWMTLVLSLAASPLLLGLMAWKTDQRGWLPAMVTLSALMAYCFLTALMGDGYFDLQRHTILCFSLGALSLILLLASPLLAFHWLGRSRIAQVDQL